MPQGRCAVSPTRRSAIRTQRFGEANGTGAASMHRLRGSPANRAEYAACQTFSRRP